MKKQTNGITLIEMLLVMVIAMSFIVLAIRQYQIWRHDADIRQLQYNVSTLFQAMNGFYKANCAPAEGKLNPNQEASPPVVVNVADDLQDYMTAPLPVSPLVNNADNNGYILQFNQYTQDRNACVEPNGKDCDKEQKIGEVVVWMSQVAVKLAPSISNNATAAQAYLHLLNGDCLSKMDGNKVEPCPSEGGLAPIIGPGEAYVVWQRAPSFTTSENKSSYWVTNPTLNQFTQQYRTYSDAYILNTKGSTPTKKQYFYCGE